VRPPGDAAARAGNPGGRTDHHQADEAETTVAEDLRRRRVAADRLPPMPCGHRDPLECLAGHDDGGDERGDQGDGMVRLTLVIDLRGGPHQVTRERVAQVREQLAAAGASAAWIDGVLRAIWGNAA
jgi:hypothetical protein